MAAQAQPSQIQKNAERRSSLDHEPAQPVTDSIRGQLREDLVQAVQNCRRHCIQKPWSRHLSFLSLLVWPAFKSMPVRTRICCHASSASRLVSSSASTASRYCFCNSTYVAI